MAKKVAIGNICSLMFFCMFLIMFYIKVKKTCFYVFFYLQINVLTSMLCIMSRYTHVAL